VAGDASAIGVQLSTALRASEGIPNPQPDGGRTAARIGLTGANRTVPSSRNAAFLHEQMRAFETRRPLRRNKAESRMVEPVLRGGSYPPESTEVRLHYTWGVDRGRTNGHYAAVADARKMTTKLKSVPSTWNA
jgi:hypothetical protein